MPDIAGLKLIVPTSVAGSGVSVSASGKVTFTSATTININGCFTSAYDNYLVVMQHDHSVSNGNLLARLRASGTDASGSNYAYQYLLARSTSVSGFRNTGQSAWDTSYPSSEMRNGAHFYFYGPNLAQPTAMRSVTVSSYINASLHDFATTHSLSTAYDGVTFYHNSGNSTGTLTIYGLSQ